MGRLKESIPDYVYEGDMDLDHYALKEEINDYLSRGIFEDKSLLREFLEEVTPYRGTDYFAYVQESKDNYVNLRFCREDYINALCCLSQYELTLYYHLASFNDWITNDNAKAVRCLYVDIDDIGMRADETSKEDAVRFLKDNFNLDEDTMPNYVILSGNGMHIAYLIDEITLKEESVRQKYTLSLITHFQGDFAGLPISHQFRCPESYNMKETPIKGKLFKLNESNNKDIHRLDVFLKSEEEIETYRRSYYKRRGEKQKATIAKNKKLEKEFLEKIGDESLSDYLKRPSLSPEEIKIAKKLLKIQLKREEILRREQEIAELENRILNYSPEDLDFYIYSENNLPYLHLKKYNGYNKNNRNMNLILDLHHFFIAHKGCLVSRTIFFYILACLFKIRKSTKENCISWCSKYCDNEFKYEMEHIVELTYKSKVKYRFSNIQIANCLCFTEEDIANSWCNFSEERKAEAKKIRNKTAYKNKLAKENKLTCEEKKAIRIQFLKDNPDILPEEAMEALDIKSTTYYKLKKLTKNTAEG